MRTTSVVPRLACAAALAAAAFGGPVAARAGDPPVAPANPLRGADVKMLVEKAQEMEGKDVRALGAALTALGDPVKERSPADLDFLVEYAVRETSRPLRLLAVESADRIDAAAAAAAFLKIAQTEKDAVRATLAVESLGYVGTKEHVAPLLDLLKHPSEMVDVAAADALARLGTTKDVTAIVDAGLAHAESHVTDHTAWAIQDIVPKPKTVAGMYEKIASKKSDPRSIRAAATQALLLDKQAEPHKWTSPFAEARKALAAAPEEIPVKGNAEYVPKVQAALAWLKEKLPAEHWMVAASVKQVIVPGPSNETRPDLDASTLEVALADAVFAPNKIAYLLERQGIVLWRKRIGEPFRGHRGWEPAIFDSYDLCAIGKLYDAGPGGLSRERFVSQIVEQRPWGGL